MACAIGAAVGVVLFAASAIIPMSDFVATSVQFTGMMIFIISLVTLTVPKRI
jgi:hypothetical protein